jgi:hypothetical protein
MQIIDIDMYFRLILLTLISIDIIIAHVDIPIGRIISFYEYTLVCYQERTRFILGLLVSRDDRDAYVRLNTLARQYVLTRLQHQTYSYSFIESFNEFDRNNRSEIDVWSRLCTQLSDGIISIISDSHANHIDWLTGFSSTYQIPLLSLGQTNYMPKKFFLSFMPDLLPALVAFIHRYQICQLVYIYDDSHGAQRLKQLMQIQTSTIGADFNIISRYLDNPDDPYDLLENIELVTNIPVRSFVSTNASPACTGRYIVLDLHSFNTYRTMMDKIKHRGMTTSEYHYILLTLDAKQLDMTYFRYGGVNVTFFTLPTVDDLPSQELLMANYRHLFNQLASIDSSTIETLILADIWETLIRTIDDTIDFIDINGKVNQHFLSDLTCQTRTIEPWRIGQNLFERLLTTNFHGLTGQVQFSNMTGQRINYTLNIHRVTRNEMPKHIGVFHEPSTFEVGQIVFDMSLSDRKKIAHDRRTQV